MKLSITAKPFQMPCIAHLCEIYPHSGLDIVLEILDLVMNKRQP